MAGGHQVDLHLACPTTGGVRIYGNDEGYFKPAELLTDRKPPNPGLMLRPKPQRQDRHQPRAVFGLSSITPTAKK